jgi:hypothetical protein
MRENIAAGIQTLATLSFWHETIHPTRNERSNESYVTANEKTQNEWMC